VIARKAALGGMLMVAARLITRLIDLVTMLVLARILMPTDFGLVAIAASVVAVVEAALELPVNQALLRLPVITTPQYDTAFTISLLRGLLLSVILIAGSWPFANFYADDRLIPLICVLSFAPLARGLTSPRLAEYQKNMSFWRDFAVELSGKLVGFAAGVATALATDSYWAIAVGTVVYTLAMAAGSYRLAPYRPRLSLSELPVFSGFVGWMSAAQVISALNWQFERLLLGKLKTTSQLGLFTTASDIANIPFLALFGPLLRPMLAAFSLLREEPERLARSYQTAACAGVAIGVPLLVGESLIAEATVRLILGEKWLGAVPLVQWLALSLIPALFALPAGPLFMSFGKTKIFVWRNTVELCVKLPAALAGALMFGFAGIIAARFLAELCADIFCIIVVRQLLGLSVREQVMGPWRSIVATAVMVVPVMACLQYLGSGTNTTQAATTVLVAAAVGIGTYSLAMWGLWRVSGRPHGIESMVIGAVSGILGKVSGKAWRYS